MIDMLQKPFVLRSLRLKPRFRAEAHWRRRLEGQTAMRCLVCHRFDGKTWLAGCSFETATSALNVPTALSKRQPRTSTPPLPFRIGNLGLQRPHLGRPQLGRLPLPFETLLCCPSATPLRQDLTEHATSPNGEAGRGRSRPRPPILNTVQPLQSRRPPW